jgi:hypothetical protein
VNNATTNWLRKISHRNVQRASRRRQENRRIFRATKYALSGSLDSWAGIWAAAATNWGRDQTWEQAETEEYIDCVVFIGLVNAIVRPRNAIMLVFYPFDLIWWLFCDGNTRARALVSLWMMQARLVDESAPEQRWIRISRVG